MLIKTICVGIQWFWHYIYIKFSPIDASQQHTKIMYTLYEQYNFRQPRTPTQPPLPMSQALLTC